MTETDQILTDLSDVQKRAVTYEAGPLLIFAGAGSGKTRVLTHRMAYLVKEQNIHPDRIMAVTFTNKAAGEMKERVETMMPVSAGWNWVSTFHSSCVRILRSDAHQIGYNSNFVIYDDADQLSLIKSIIKQLDIDDDGLDPRFIRGQMDRAKCDALDPSKREVPRKFSQNYKRIAEQYGKQLKKNNAFDFGDLIVKTIELLETVDSLREYYNERFLHILVDEFQDTNIAQYKLLKLLLGEHRNICVVGDDDQSIYSWRGAKVRNILDFEKDFPNSEIIILGENYRSSKIILEAAAAVIEQNNDRKAKELFTKNRMGDQIAMFRAEDQYAEARYVLKSIMEENTKRGTSFADMAIFYRTNAQSRVLEEELSRNAIPFQVIGGVRFYERKEIKDVLAYLRAVVNPDDSVSIKRIINLPARGIGKTTIEKIDLLAFERDVTFLEAVRMTVEEELLAKRTVNNLDKFLAILDELTHDTNALNPQGAVRAAIDRSGYDRMLERDKSVEAMSRRENLRELTHAVGEFQKEFPEGDLVMFLEQVALVADQDTIDDRKSSVHLMTIHSAKGLEFSTVWIVGLDEGLFPHSRSIDQPDELQEERRLFYVAITRSRKRLFLTSSEKRRSFTGYSGYTIRSRFLDDIPESLIKVESIFSGRSFSNGGNKASGNQFSSGQPYKKAGKPKKKTSSLPDEPTIDYSYSQDPEDSNEIVVGAQVRHAKLGEGRVVFVEGEGEYATAIVQFERHGIKKLRMQYAKLVRI